MKLNNQYYILRHGLSTSNTQNYFSAWPEKRISRLVPEGKKQIKKAGQFLKKLGLDLIFSSDLHRTKQTSAIVSKITKIKVIFNKEIREINPGIFNNTNNGDYTHFFNDNAERLTKQPLHGENLLDCQKRMANAIKKIDKKYKDKKILIVSHGNPLWLLEGSIKNWNRQKLLKEYKNRIMYGEYRKLN